MLSFYLLYAVIHTKEKNTVYTTESYEMQISDAFGSVTLSCLAISVFVKKPKTF